MLHFFQPAGFFTPVRMFQENEPYQIRCPIHGSIHFSQLERKVIDHPLVQRLRHIAQLGLCALVFPAATHSRFSHALGVMHLSSQVFDRICANATCLKSDVFSPKKLAYSRKILRLAGLLHDLGHGPFSHSSEPLLPARSTLNLPSHWYDAQGAHSHVGNATTDNAEDNTVNNSTDNIVEPTNAHLLASSAVSSPSEKSHQAHHEDFSISMIYALCQGKHAVLAEDIARDVAALIDDRIQPSAAILGKGSPLPLLKQIISGEVDADRMDYLMRDALFTGVAYGRFDMARLIDSLSCSEQNEGISLVIKDSGLHAYEDFLLARLHMILQIYQHKTLLCFEYFFQQSVLQKEVTFHISTDLTEFLAATDSQLWQLLRQNQHKPWAGRLTGRKPFSRLLHIQQVADPVLWQATMEALREGGVEPVCLSRKAPTKPFSSGMLLSKKRFNREHFSALSAASPLLAQCQKALNFQSLYCDGQDKEKAIQIIYEAGLEKQWTQAIDNPKP